MKITDRSVIERLLDGFADKLTPDAARAIVRFRAAPAERARVAELAELCNEGRLTPAERAEYAAYVRGIDFISLLQSKARRYLKQARKR